MTSLTLLGFKNMKVFSYVLGLFLIEDKALNQLPEWIKQKVHGLGNN